MRVDTFLPKPLEQQKGLHMETLVESETPQNPLISLLVHGLRLFGLKTIEVSWLDCPMHIKGRCFVSRMQSCKEQGENGSWLGPSPGRFFHHSLAAFQIAKTIKSRLEAKTKEECTTIWCAHKLKALFSSTKFSKAPTEFQSEKSRLRQTKCYLINLVITRLFGVILRSSVTKLPSKLSSLRPSGLTMHTVFTAWMARSLIKVPNLSHCKDGATNIRHFADSWE